MCRIIGAVGRELDSQFIGNIFLELEHMGRDATGFWFPTTNIIKQPKKVTDFLPEVRETFEEGIRSSNVFIGHTRYATHGDPKYNYNNHPIESENWIIVHNGVVDMKDIKDYNYKTNTDTENILAYIETFGLEKGLEYCTKGASIILVNKQEADTLYIWKTFQGDMTIAYDMDRENIYITSGDVYFWKALAPEAKNLEKLGGLFSVVERRLSLIEPSGRDLWKIHLMNGELQAAKIANVPIKQPSYNYYHNQWLFDPQTSSWYQGGYSQWKQQLKEQKEENNEVFVEMGKGTNRPKVKEKKITTTTKQVIKNSNGNGMMYGEIFYPGDIVSFKRDLCPNDLVTCEDLNKVNSLDMNTQFRVRTVIHSSLELGDRVSLARTTDDTVFIVPKDILQMVEPPTCLGIAYNPIFTKCKICLHNHLCQEAMEFIKDMPPLQCIGKFNSDDENCTGCMIVALCIIATNEADFQEATEASKGDCIDAEFEEVNSSVIKETTGGNFSSSV